MTKLQIETWARQIIDRVMGNRPTEDSNVELKREWIADTRKAARQIAGLANAARGEPILWLVGVQEKPPEITGASKNELADWWAKVESHFDGVSPRMHDHNFDIEGKTVVALQMETDASLFVVKTGLTGEFTYDVPWRVGTRTRSAMRADLFSMLIPVQRLPDVELLSGSLTLTHHQTPTLEAKNFSDLEARIYLFVAPKTQDLLVIPYHRCVVTATVGGRKISMSASNIGNQATAARYQCVLYNPEVIYVDAQARIDLLDLGDQKDCVQMRLQLGFSDVSRVVVREFNLTPGEEWRPTLNFWEVGTQPR